MQQHIFTEYIQMHPLSLLVGPDSNGSVRMSLYSTYGISVKSLLKYMVTCVLMCLSAVCSKTK